MLADKFKGLGLAEEGYIGQEILDESSVSDTERKCITIRETVEDGDFTLEKALSLYGVTRLEYDNFIAKDEGSIAS